MYGKMVVYVVTVCTVEFAVSVAVDLLYRCSERSDMRNAKQVHISDCLAVSQLSQCRHESA